ncbi:MAG: hypothetical protein JKY27_11055 [Magnetovibrio sp.]|nr:hypothetical protein [Magnetovibrio sp.]
MPVFQDHEASKRRNSHMILARHGHFLQARLNKEPNEMRQNNLQARINNLVLAQKQLQAEFMQPGLVGATAHN